MVGVVLIFFEGLCIFIALAPLVLREFRNIANIITSPEPLLPFLGLERALLCSLGWSRVHYAAQGSLEPAAILLPQHPQGYN